MEFQEIVEEIKDDLLNQLPIEFVQLPKEIIVIYVDNINMNEIPPYLFYFLDIHVV